MPGLAVTACHPTHGILECLLVRMKILCGGLFVSVAHTLGKQQQ